METALILVATALALVAVVGILAVAWLLLWDGVAVFRRNIPNDKN